MQSMTRVRRFTAAAALAALAASGTAVAVSTTAIADEAAATATPTAAPTFPTGTTGSLTIHKHKTPASGATASTGGLKAKDAPNDPIEGVQFTIKKIEGIDLSTNEGWKAAESLSKNVDLSAVNGDTTQLKDGDKTYNLAAKAPQSTSEQGEATFSGLDLGLYLVLETNVDGATLDGQPLKVKPAAPFIVSIPLTNPENHDQWMTDIHVYPKNTPKNDIIEKAVADSGKQLGDTITFTVTTGINANDAKSKSGITQYIIKDPIDNNLTVADAKRVKVKITGGDADSELTKDIDYSAEIVAGENGVNKMLVITFQQPGLTKITDAKKAKDTAKVVTTFDATVTTLPGDGTVKNTAYIFGNDADASQLSGGDPSNEVVSKWGKIEFVKKNSAGATLSGAEFIVTNCNDKTPIAINGVTTFTSGEDGKIAISGIHVSAFVDGVAVKDDSKVKYCLDEVKAPTDYELLPGHAAEFTVSQLVAGEQAASTFDLAQAQAGGDIVNYPKNGGFNLPLTGAQGLAAAGIAGALLVAGGTILVVRRRRQDEAA